MLCCINELPGALDANPLPLTVDQVYHRCPSDQFDFDTTATLEPLDLPCGQERVVRALEFGARMKNQGFNLFVLGPSGASKHELVAQFLKQHAAKEKVPSDWCYVFNFEFPDRPTAIELPAGEGRQFKADMNTLADELRTAIPATFESEEYQGRLQELQEEMSKRQHKGLFAIQEEANRSNIAMIATPAGFTFAPMKDGEVMDPEEYQKLSDDERTLIEAKVEDLQKKLQQTIQQVPRLRKEVRERVHALNEEMTQLTLGDLSANCARSGVTRTPWWRFSMPSGRTWLVTPKRSVTRTAAAHRPACSDAIGSTFWWITRIRLGLR